MFEIGQDALCEHAGTLYPAKIVAIEPIEADATHDATTGIAEPRKYLVHYHGWKKRHDEWIPPNQVTLTGSKISSLVLVVAAVLRSCSWISSCSFVFRGGFDMRQHCAAGGRPAFPQRLGGGRAAGGTKACC